MVETPGCGSATAFIAKAPCAPWQCIPATLVSYTVASRAGSEQSRAALSAEAARRRVFGHAARAAHKVLRGGDRSPQPYLKGGRLRKPRIDGLVTWKRLAGTGG